MTYAANTSVAPEKTRAEIERLVMKHGGTTFAYGVEPNAAQVMFDMRDRRVLFRVQFVPLEKHVSRAAAERRREQRVRSRWRALLLVIKAKLEAVDSGVETFEQAFLAHLLIPGKGTVGDRLIPSLDDVFDGRPMPPLLGA
jgi:hypothetical protein